MPFETHAGAQQVQFFQTVFRLVLSALSREPETRIERPGVSGDHFDVDDAVAVGDRPDLDFVEIAVVSQVTLGLFYDLYRDRFATFEQQGAADDIRAGAYVEKVRCAVEGVVFFRIVQVEYILVIDLDFADDGALGLELFECRQPLALLCNCPLGQNKDHEHCDHDHAGRYARPCPMAHASSTVH